MQDNDEILFYSFTQTTNNSSIKNNKIKPMKCSFNIQSSSQLNNYLMNENIYLTKNILFFLITALRQFHRNLIIFYEILKSLLEKLNNPFNDKSFIYEKNDSFYINLIINDYNKEINIINKNFDNIFTLENIEHFLFSNNKHKVNVLLYSFMVTFTFYTEKIEKIKRPRNDIFKLLESLKEKYICNSETSKLCECCCYNSIIKIISYLNQFNEEKKSKMKKFVNIYKIEKEKEEEIKKIDNLYNKIYNIEKNIRIFEKLIQKNKSFSINIQKELNQFDLYYKNYQSKK